jgi:hypothetical protein
MGAVGSRFSLFSVLIMNTVLGITELNSVRLRLLRTVTMLTDEYGVQPVRIVEVSKGRNLPREIPDFGDGFQGRGTSCPRALAG